MTRRMPPAPQPRAVLAAALATAVALAGCTEHPHGEENTTAPTATFATVPDAAEEEPLEIGDALTTATVWTGAKDASDLSAVVSGDLVVLGGRGPDGVDEMRVLDAARRTTLWTARSAGLGLGTGAVLATDLPGSTFVGGSGDDRVLYVSYGVRDCPPGGDCTDWETRSAGVVAIDAARHTVKWKRTLRERDPDRDGISPGAARAIGVAGEILVADVVDAYPWKPGIASEVVGLDSDTGRVRWRATGHLGGYAADGTVVTTTLARGRDPIDDRAVATGLVGLDPATGTPVWRTPLPEPARIQLLTGTARFALAVAEDTGRGYLLDARTGALVRRLGDNNADCQVREAEVVCLDAAENHLKVVDLGDGTQSVVPTPRLTRRLFGDDGSASYVALDETQLVLDRDGKILSDKVTSSILAAGDGFVVRAGDTSDPSNPTASGPASLVHVVSR